MTNTICVTFQHTQKYEKGKNSGRFYDICHVLNIHMAYLNIHMAYLFHGLNGLNTEGVLRKRNGIEESTLLQKTCDGGGYMDKTETFEQLVRFFWRIPNLKARQELLERIHLLHLLGRILGRKRLQGAFEALSQHIPASQA